MATKHQKLKRTGEPSWRPSDVDAATAEAARTLGDSNAQLKRDPVEVGARAIYEFRSHPRKAPWPHASDDIRALHRSQMSGLLETLKAAGYQVRRQS